MSEPQCAESGFICWRNSYNINKASSLLKELNNISIEKNILSYDGKPYLRLYDTYNLAKNTFLKNVKIKGNKVLTEENELLAETLTEYDDKRLEDKPSPWTVIIKLLTMVY